MTFSCMLAALLMAEFFPACISAIHQIMVF